MEEKKTKTKDNHIYELVYSNSEKVNLGDYSQRNPFYSIKKLVPVLSLEELSNELKDLRTLIDNELRLNVQEIKTGLRAKTMTNFRFYEKDGKKYVSVTSILDPEPKTPEQQAFLKPYGIRGSALHRVFGDYVTSGKLIYEFLKEEVDGCSSVGGFEGFKFWFQGDERFDFRRSEIEVYNEKELYAGRFDADGYFDEHPALFDLKSGDLGKSGVDKAFCQLAGYNACLEEPAEALVIIPINPKYKNEPIIKTGDEITKYFNMFMAKRKAFKEKYGF